MNAFMTLSTKDQATVVLISLLDDVAMKRRTYASVEHSVNELYEFLSKQFNVPVPEVAMVVNEVAGGGIRMLPGYEEEQTSA